MKCAYFFILIHFIFHSSASGQVINSDLTIQFENFVIQVSKTSMDKIELYFEKDSIIKIANEGIYVFIENELSFFACDKNEDRVVDLISVYSPSFQTWNNIKMGNNFNDVKNKFPSGNIGVNWDFANLIYYSCQPLGKLITLGFYFDVEMQDFIPDFPPNKLEEIFLKNSEL